MPEEVQYGLQFAFYRILQVLFKDVKFAKLSTDAKVLYELILLNKNADSAFLFNKQYGGTIWKYAEIYI